MIISCTVRVICYDNRNSPVTVLTYMCIIQDTFIDIVMSWYDHYCADANILILSYLPCWSYIFSAIAFIMWKSFVCKFVLLMLNVSILVHIDSFGCFVICHVFYCILCCICIFTMYFVRNGKINLWNHLSHKDNCSHGANFVTIDNYSHGGIVIPKDNCNYGAVPHNSNL